MKLNFSWEDEREGGGAECRQETECFEQLASVLVHSLSSQAGGILDVSGLYLCLSKSGRENKGNHLRLMVLDKQSQNYNKQLYDFEVLEFQMIFSLFVTNFKKLKAF
jgi:hypothetical protein